MCRVLTGIGRGRAPNKGQPRIMDALMKIPLGGMDESAHSALAEEADPLQDLMAGDDCAGGQSDDTQQLETPKKRSRKQLTAAEQEFCVRVRMTSLVSDLSVFKPADREEMQQGSVRILVKTNRGRSVYVHSKDLDLIMLALHSEIERFGVPSVGLPDEASALAEVPHWFDSRTSRWCVRRGDEVHTSQRVPRTGAYGRPLDVETFKVTKDQILEDLLAKLGPAPEPE